MQNGIAKGGEVVIIIEEILTGSISRYTV